MCRVLSTTPEFRDVPDFPGYAVSNDGRVRSTKTHGRRRYRDQLSYEMAITPDSGGYLGVKLCSGGKVKRFAVHVLVLTVFSGQKPLGMEGRHKNGNKLDNRAENLEWTTRKINAGDRILHGTQVRGETTGTAKLTRENVEEILRSTRSISALARHYQVGRTAIRRVKLRQTWQHVTADV